jgi:hypothetical protein
MLNGGWMDGGPLMRMIQWHGDNQWFIQWETSPSGKADFMEQAGLFAKLRTACIFY